MPTNLSGNKGEWSEIYIFLKLMNDGKIYAADKDMKKIATVYLNIIKIIREEFPSQTYEYFTGDPIKICLNGSDAGPDVPLTQIEAMKNELWELFQTAGRGNFSSEHIEDFLSSIHIFKLKAPATSKAEFFGGTQDIIMSVIDYRNGITSTVGFSCKSDFSHKSTLFNASKDNTNFRYKLTGMTDELMERVNNTFNIKQKLNKETGLKETKYEIAISDRISLMKNSGVDIHFDKAVVDNATRNLILSGGTEMPKIVGAMLLNYYWNNNAETAHSSIVEATQYIITSNSADYNFDGLESIYKRKIGNLLYDMFTGMRLSKEWDGRSSVNGGYIVAKDDGDVLAYHSCIADEFKDFLVEKLGFEAPSSSRHNAIQVYKIEDEYFINFNLQVRFK